jgi:hypothetical protein
MTASNAGEVTSRLSLGIERERYAPAVAAEESLQRAESLLDRLEEARARLETTEDPEAALEILGELSEIAKEVDAEIQRAKRAAEAEADAEG